MMAAKKKNRLLASAVAGCLCSNAAYAAEIDMNTAQMQAMDKITGRVSVINVPVNTDVKFGSFSIVVRACKTRPPEDTPENFAFADIVDSYNNEQPMNIFRGWLMSSTPGLNAVEHPIYDVWLLKCINTDVDKSKLMTAEQLKDRDGIVRAPQITEREEYKSPQLSVDEAEQIPEVEFVFEETVIEDKPVVEAIETENVTATTEEPLLIAPDVSEEDGAPKSLLNIGGIQESSAINENKESEEPASPLVEIEDEKESEIDLDLSVDDEVSENEKTEETSAEKVIEDDDVEDDEQLFSFDD